MIIFKATGIDLNSNEKFTKNFKTASTMKMKSLVNELIYSDFFVEEWEMTRKLPKADRWGSNIDWTMGNKGINSEAHLHDIIKEM